MITASVPAWAFWAVVGYFLFTLLLSVSLVRLFKYMSDAFLEATRRLDASDAIELLRRYRVPGLFEPLWRRDLRTKPRRPRGVKTVEGVPPFAGRRPW